MKSVVCTLLMGLMFSFWHGTHRTWADKIVFVCHRGKGAGGEDEICTVNPNGGQRRTLTKKPPNVIKNWPAWSPDRTGVLFATFIPSALYLMDADGGNLTLLKENYRGERPAWSPDGRQIAYGGTGPWIAILDVRTRKEELIFVPVDQVRDMAWSPDGRQIAFYSQRNENNSGISLIDREGNNVRELTTGGEIYPSWSPDGTQIVFSSFFDGKLRIGVMDADGHHLKLIAEGHSPSWQSTFPGLAVQPVEKLVSIWGQIKSDGGLR